MGRGEMRGDLRHPRPGEVRGEGAAIGPEAMLYHERMIMLQIVDSQWKDHLYALDHLKEGIGLRGYGQRDPLVEYKKRAYNMFQALMDRIDEEILRWVFLAQPVPPPGPGGGRTASATAGRTRRRPGRGGVAARPLAQPRASRAGAGAGGRPAPMPRT